MKVKDKMPERFRLNAEIEKVFKVAFSILQRADANPLKPQGTYCNTGVKTARCVQQSQMMLRWGVEFDTWREKCDGAGRALSVH